MPVFTRFPSRIVFRTGAVGLLLTLAACNDNDSAPATQAARLPVTTSEVMNSLINHAADPLFDVSWGRPASMDEWAAVEMMARQLQLGGTLLTTPGTGPMDGAWATDATFIDYSRRLSAAAARAVSAARAEDQAELNQIAGELNAVCNGCHAAFATGVPQIDLLR